MNKPKWYYVRDVRRFVKATPIEEISPVEKTAVHAKHTANRTLEDIRDYRRRATFPEVLDLLSGLRKAIKESMAFEPDEWVVLDSICRISLLKISRLQDELNEKGLLEQL